MQVTGTPLSAAKRCPLISLTAGCSSVAYKHRSRRLCTVSAAASTDTVSTQADQAFQSHLSRVSRQGSGSEQQVAQGAAEALVRKAAHKQAAALEALGAAIWLEQHSKSPSGMQSIDRSCDACWFAVLAAANLTRGCWCCRCRTATCRNLATGRSTSLQVGWSDSQVPTCSVVSNESVVSLQPCRPIAVHITLVSARLGSGTFVYAILTHAQQPHRNSSKV